MKPHHSGFPVKFHRIRKQNLGSRDEADAFVGGVEDGVVVLEGLLSDDEVDISGGASTCKKNDR